VIKAGWMNESDGDTRFADKIFREESSRKVTISKIKKKKWE
jgi:hypothetical protein